MTCLEHISRFLSPIHMLYSILSYILPSACQVRETHHSKIKHFYIHPLIVHTRIGYPFFYISHYKNSSSFAFSFAILRLLVALTRSVTCESWHSISSLFSFRFKWLTIRLASVGKLVGVSVFVYLLGLLFSGKLQILSSQNTYHYFVFTQFPLFS